MRRPLDTIKVSAEGTVSYEALLFIPAKTPMTSTPGSMRRGCSSTPPGC